MPPASKFRLDDAIAALSAAGRMAATSIWSPHPKPTPAQARANDYPVGYATWQGIPVRIENPAHSIREGRDPGGKPWRNLLAADYGDFPGTLGADGDAVDVFIGPFPESSRVWILNQHTANGGFDEHKVLAGFTDARHATDAYRNSYSPGWSRFDPPIPASLAQLRHWLKHADKSRPFSLDQVPLETDMTDTTAIAPAMRRVFWDSEGDPGAGRTWASVVYDLRLDDAGQDLLTDPLTMADVLEGQTIEVLDAMVVQAGKLMPKMAAFQRILNAAGTDLQALTMQLSDVVKRFGGAHVAAIFELSDGQTITLWFHNPDATPNKFGPADDLVSWKVQLNKKDVTIVVAPEKGEDLNLREVGRRLMKLAGRNSAAFAKANALRAATMQTIAELKAAVPEKQATLAGLLHQIDVAKVAKADREAVPPQPDPVIAENAWNGQVAKLLQGRVESPIGFVATHAIALVAAREAGKTPEEAVDALLPPEPAPGVTPEVDESAFKVGSVILVPFAQQTARGMRVWGVRVVENGASFNGADGSGSWFKSDTKAHMIEDLERAYSATMKGGDPVKNENRWRSSFDLPPLKVEEPAPADSPDAAYLRDVARGTHDGEDLGTLLSKLSTAIMALSDAGALAGAADQAANDAITHWVELDQRVNG